MWRCDTRTPFVSGLLFRSYSDSVGRDATRGLMGIGLGECLHAYVPISGTHHALKWVVYVFPGAVQSQIQTTCLVGAVRMYLLWLREAKP